MPKLVAVKDSLSDINNKDNFTTLDSFRLLNQESGGAIGFRVEKNLKQYSPLEWFYQKQFKGEPESLTIDGFNAVRSGNTVYIGFGNVGLYNSNKAQFTNILVISLAQPASAEMENIFNQIIDGMQFVRNVKDVGLCYSGVSPQNQMCTKDSDCGIAKKAAGPAGKTFVQTYLTSSSNYVGITCTVNAQGKYPQVLYNPTTNVLSPDSKGATYPTGVAVYDSSSTFNAFKTFAGICNTKLPLGTCEKYPTLSCVDDVNCPGSKCVISTTQTCNVEQTKFRRDAIRVIDSSVMTRAIKNAQAIANSYPIIAKDSFIPGITSSRWPSWSSFMNQLGIVTLTDPINEYSACAADADAATCWSVKSKKYQCGLSSSVYHYRTIESGKGYQLGIPLEQTTGQQGMWQGDWNATVKSKIDNNFCVDEPLVAASVCGDGAIGVGEQCDPAGSSVSGTDAALCTSYGNYVGKCSATCQIEQKQCVNLCGDGIVQSPAEKCDDGSKYNGQYNHCGLNCQYDNALGSCGNGTIEKNEVCDIGSAQGRVFLLARYNNGVYLNQGIRCVNTALGYETVEFDPATKTFIAPKLSFTPTPGELSICKSTSVIGMCEKYQTLSCESIVNCPSGSECVKPVVGTKYSKAEVNSCNWNCKSLGSYCGDKVVNAADGEQCDGNTRGNQCTNYCTNECKWLKTPVNNVPVCDKDPDVVLGPKSGCGDGTVEPENGEECDLGLDVPNCDPTKTSCKVGGQNGIACVPAYGQTNSCQYCTASCKKGYVSGGFCGDGKLDGPEVCDKLSFSQVCDPAAFDYHTLECAQSCVIKEGVGSCQSCAINTTNYTAANKSAPDTIHSNVKLEDPTLGWLPGYTGVNVSFYRGSTITKTGKEVYEHALTPYKSNSNIFAVVGNIPKQGGVPIKTFNQIAFDAKSTCFEGGRRYSLDFVSTADKGSMNQYEVDKLGTAFGAFQYSDKQQSYLTAASLEGSNTVQIIPKGDEGDYRIVMSGHQLLGFNLKMSNKTGQINSVYEAPNLSGYTVGIVDSGLCGTESIIDIYTDFDQRLGYSGCLAGAPYAEYDRLFGFDSNGAVTKESGRHILTIKKHQGSFYNGVYEVSVMNLLWQSEPLNSTNKIVVYKYTSGAWTKVYEIAPPTKSALFWDAFTFVGNDGIKPGDYSKYNEIDLGNPDFDNNTPKIGTQNNQFSP